MLSILGMILFESLPRALNILLCLGGDGNLLSADVFPSTVANDPQEVTFPLIVLTFTHFVVSSLVRYLLGNVAVTLLILSISRIDGSSEYETKEPVQFRHVFRTIRHSYGRHTIYSLFRGPAIGLLYHLLHLEIKLFLEEDVFNHRLIMRPFSYAGASVILCELHMFWTCATISASKLPRLRLTRAWHHLAVPSFLYGLSQFFMYQLQTSIEFYTLHKSALFTILRMIILLALRLFALLPTNIAVVVSETSLLPRSMVTIIPSRAKPRGVTVAELFGGSGILPGFAAMRSALKGFGKHQYLWLMELHFKKCFIQTMTEFATGLPIMMLGVFYSRK